MLIATWSQVMPLLILCGLVVVLALAADVWLVRKAIRGSVEMRIVCAVGFVLSSGACLVAAFLFLLGLAVGDCPPDATDCI
jgi:hypothetical protein